MGFHILPAEYVGNARHDKAGNLTIGTGDGADGNKGIGTIGKFAGGFVELYETLVDCVARSIVDRRIDYSEPGCNGCTENRCDCEHADDRRARHRRGLDQ